MRRRQFDFEAAGAFVTTIAFTLQGLERLSPDQRPSQTFFGLFDSCLRQVCQDANPKLSRN